MHVKVHSYFYCVYQEDFLDISIPVSTQDTLQQALEELYIHTEVLEATNQYRCNACDQLVDATRVSTCHICGIQGCQQWVLLAYHSCPTRGISRPHVNDSHYHLQWVLGFNSFQACVYVANVYIINHYRITLLINYHCDWGVCIHVSLQLWSSRSAQCGTLSGVCMTLNS